MFLKTTHRKKKNLFDICIFYKESLSIIDLILYFLKEKIDLD